ncbi:MAG TPA: GatB/YqeY domain-containing protein [Anaerolineae bacterium]|nr:GatB/YqeY domain-containing protein [Anaerolineae bacterium]
MLTKEELQSNLHQAMRDGDDVRKRTLRMVLTAVKLAEVEKMEALDDAELIAVIQKEAKMRRESIEFAGRAERQDLIGDLESELAVLNTFLPQPFSAEELRALAQEAITEAGATGPQDMGKVMKILMPKVQGRADGKAVSEAVRGLLATE